MQKDFRTAWLLLLLRDGSSYGYELRRELTARNMTVDPAVMYRTLREMECGGLISSHWVASDTGPKRRVYDLTAQGRAELGRIAADIDRERQVQSEFLAAFDGRKHGRTRASP